MAGLEIIEGCDDDDGFRATRVVRGRAEAVWYGMQQGGLLVFVAAMNALARWGPAMLQVLVAAEGVVLFALSYRATRRGAVSFGRAGIRSQRTTAPWSNVASVQIEEQMRGKFVVVHLRTTKRRRSKKWRLDLPSGVRQYEGLNTRLVELIDAQRRDASA